MVKTNKLKAVIQKCINGQKYQIIVKAVNGTASETSKPSRHLIPLGVPKAPKLICARPHDRAARIEWTCEDLAIPDEAITHFQFNESLSREAKRSWINIGSKCPAIIPKLKNGKEYTFYIRAVNKRGYSKPSNAIKCTPLAPPPKPVNVEAIPGNAAADVFWVCADVSQQKFNGWFVIKSDQSERSYECKRLRCRIRRLQNGIPYRFTVTAQNLAGQVTSDPSPAIICKRETRNSIFELRSKELRSLKNDQNIAFQKTLQAEERRRRMAEKKSHHSSMRNLNLQLSKEAAERAKLKEHEIQKRAQRANQLKVKRMQDAVRERKKEGR